MVNKMHQTINPTKFWEKFVIPHKLKPEATFEEKSWPDYITHDPAAVVEPHENKFQLSRTSSHDGNIVNTYELLWTVLKPLVFMNVISNNFKGRKDYNAIKYTIGDILIECELDATIIMGDRKERGNVETATLDVISFPHTIVKPPTKGVIH